MGVKILKLNIFRGSTNRHALFRALIITSVLSLVPLMELLPGTESTKTRVSDVDAAMDLVDLGRFVFPGPKLFLNKLVKPFLGKLKTGQFPEAVLASITEELLRLKLLEHDAKILCIGPGSDSAVSVFKEMGFSDVYESELGGENSFDFVFCGDVEQVTSPAHLVLDMERALKPGGIGAVLASSNSNSVLTSVSFCLNQTEIVHVNYLDEFITVIVMKRNVTNNCQSVETNRPYMDFMEPLLDQKSADFPQSVAYLPKFIDLSLKKKLVYINIGAAEHMDANWFFPSYPIETKAFNVYFVDHNTSVMTSYVKKPGITFVYHPGLADGKNRAPFEQLEPFPEDEGFDFLAWFEETARYADFVVLKMNTSQVEMKFLLKLHIAPVLLETGAICYVDELFLRCSNHKPDCINILQSLRNRGVFVHQWWDD